MMRLYWFLFGVLLLWCGNVCSQPVLTVMEYNCENAFDTIHDEGKNDWEFCADGEKRWSKSRLWRKLRDVSKVIAGGGEERMVDLVGLCEVENDSVLVQLTKRSPLANLGYRYVMSHSADERGIDVALLYSPFTFHLIDSECVRPSLGKHSSRNILHVWGSVASGDTVDVWVVHLPSKRGGGAAQKRSMKVATLLKECVDSVAEVREKANVIVMGDFNAEPKSPQLRLLTKGGVLTDAAVGVTPGTYKYRGDWSVIDHVLYRTTSMRHTDTRVLALPFLLEKDETHGGTKPRRTYVGPVYKGGVSDHLPLVSVFSFGKCASR